MLRSPWTITLRPRYENNAMRKKNVASFIRGSGLCVRVCVLTCICQAAHGQLH